MSESEVVIEHAGSADIPALVGLLAALFGIEQDFKPDTERQRRFGWGLGQPERLHHGCSLGPRRSDRHVLSAIGVFNGRRCALRMG